MTLRRLMLRGAFLAVAMAALLPRAAMAVEPDSESFSKAVYQLLSDMELRKRISENGANFVKDYFDISVVARQMAAQLGSIISSGKPLI